MGGQYTQSVLAWPWTNQRLFVISLPPGIQTRGHRHRWQQARHQGCHPVLWAVSLGRRRVLLEHFYTMCMSTLQFDELRPLLLQQRTPYKPIITCHAMPTQVTFVVLSWIAQMASMMAPLRGSATSAAHQ